MESKTTIDDSGISRLVEYLDAVFSDAEEMKKGDDAPKRRDDNADFGPGKRIGRGNTQGGRPPTTGEQVRAQRGLVPKGGNAGKRPGQGAPSTGDEGPPTSGGADPGAEPPLTPQDPLEMLDMLEDRIGDDHSATPVTEPSGGLSYSRLPEGEGGIHKDDTYIVTDGNGDRFLLKKTPTFIQEYASEKAAFLLAGLLGAKTYPYPSISKDGFFLAWIPNAMKLKDKVKQEGPGFFLQAIPKWREQLTHILLIDAILGNMDEHGGNLLVDADGRLYSVDNGADYHPGPMDMPKKLPSFLLENGHYLDKAVFEKDADTIIRNAKLVGVLIALTGRKHCQDRAKAFLADPNGFLKLAWSSMT